MTESKLLRILVADDNKDAADALTVLLEISGHEVLTVYDGEAAVDAATGHNPELAVLDIGMPKLNGYQVAQVLRQRLPGTVLVAVSGWGSVRDVERAREAGFHHHITKPAAFDEIDSLIRRIRC